MAQRFDAYTRACTRVNKDLQFDPTETHTMIRRRVARMKRPAAAHDTIQTESQQQPDKDYATPGVPAMPQHRRLTITGQAEIRVTGHTSSKHGKVRSTHLLERH